jgi:aminopeptidase N
MFVMQGPGTLGRTTSHELGHQWFYALVTDDQARDPWLDEGLASWAEYGYEHTLSTWISTPIPADARGQAGQPMTYWNSHSSSYYRGVYGQTPEALAALGPPAQVDCALRLYVARYAHRIARPADLIDILAQVFPAAPAVLPRYGLHR